MNAELGLDDVRWVFERLATRQRPDVSDSSIVMIGGQALNYWCDRYRSESPELNQYGPFSSKDLDFQATRDLVPWCSEQLGGKYALTPQSVATHLNGVVTVVDPNGQELSIDFLQRPYGLAAEDTTNSSATVSVHSSIATVGIKVMHPLHCLMSRVHNVMGLAAQYANEHGFRQLRAAIVCLRLFTDATAEEDPKVALRLNERLFKFALHELAAIQLFEAHTIDVFDAISVSEKLPELFRTSRYPQMRAELAKRRKQ